MEVIPALLNTDLEEFKEQLEKLLPHYTHFSIDIADGEFVRNETIQIDVITNYLSALRHGENLLAKMTFDFDLMVEDYKSEIEKIDSLAGLVKVENIFPHLKTVMHQDEYQQISKLYPDFKIGIALDPDDSVELLSTNFDLEKIPCIEILSVNPGFQGGAFIEDMLNKIEHLRMIDYRNKIFLDGGINDNTLQTILSKKYLPDVLCIGSYLTRTKDLGKKVQKLRKIALVAK